MTAADQATKAWAWRHRIDVHMNAGGDLLVRHVGAWFRDPVRGAALDIVDFALLLTAWLLLARRRHSPGVQPAAAVLLAGWSSNLFDRLGMHYWTAPGSVRGVVDWIRWDGRCWNIADIAIIVGSVTLALALGVAGGRSLLGIRPQSALRSVRRPASERQPGGRGGTGSRGVLVAVVGIAVAAVLAAVGAVAYAGVTEPLQLLATGR